VRNLVRMGANHEDCRSPRFVRNPGRIKRSEAIFLAKNPFRSLQIVQTVNAGFQIALLRVVFVTRIASAHEP